MSDISEWRLRSITVIQATLKEMNKDLFVDPVADNHVNKRTPELRGRADQVNR